MLINFLMQSLKCAEKSNIHFFLFTISQFFWLCYTTKESKLNNITKKKCRKLCCCYFVYSSSCSASVKSQPSMIFWHLWEIFGNIHESHAFFWRHTLLSAELPFPAQFSLKNSIGNTYWKKMRQSNLQRIQQRKSEMKSWPLDIKLTKLAIYSACNSDANCKCKGKFLNPNRFGLFYLL